MTFIQFAFNNVRRNTRQYVSYFLSCTFAVTVFFMYAAVVFHPDIAQTKFKEIVERGIVISEVIIYFFSFLFILYSTSAFVKSRKKEYGLLTTMGITKLQLNSMLILESTIIGVTAIAAGIATGALLTKLFLMVFSAVLGFQEILPFYMSGKAITLTGGLFFILFELNSIFVVWSLRTNSIMQVFRGKKAAKKNPRFSWLLCLLSIGAISYAYYLAFTADMLTMFIRMVPILALIIPGTYFLYSQFSIAFTTLLKRKKGYYYRGLHMLTVADLSFKLKDNAKTLFFVTILSAISFTSSGVLYGLFQSAEAEAEHYVPQDVTLGSRDKGLDKLQIEINKIENQFDAHGISYRSLLVDNILVTTKNSETKWNQVKMVVYSNTAFTKMIELHNGKPPAKLDNNTVYLLTPSGIAEYNYEVPSKLTFRTKKLQFKQDVIQLESPLNSSYYYGSFQLVVSDQNFEEMSRQADTDERHQTYAMEVPKWVDHAETIDSIMKQVNLENVFVDAQATNYLMIKETMSYLFFFGIFISVLFFLAAGSILYFRMYQNLDNDLHHFHSLYRIGLSVQEMKKIATTQLAILFFVPFIIAVIHASFAFKALHNMLSSSIFWQSFIVIAFYFCIHFANFVFIRNIYTGKLKKVM